MKHVWKGHGADSEIGNVSARQAALNRWTATDKRWKRKAVSRGSVVSRQSSPQSNLPICAIMYLIAIHSNICVVHFFVSIK